MFGPTLPYLDGLFTLVDIENQDIELTQECLIKRIVAAHSVVRDWMFWKVTTSNRL